MLKKTRTFMCGFFLLSNIISTPTQLIKAEAMVEDNVTSQELETITSETTEEMPSLVGEEGTITVYTSEELISALTNPEIHSIEFGSDITTTENVQVKVVGDFKNINGNHFKWFLESEMSQTIDFRMRVDYIKNLEIINNSPLSLHFSYGGTIENLNGTNVMLFSLGTTGIYGSQFKRVNIVTEERVEIISSHIFSDGIRIEDCKDFLIDDTQVEASTTTDAIYLYKAGGIINNSFIDGGLVGIRAVGFASDLLVQNSIVSNSQMFGISNEPVNGDSLIKINNVVIEKSGSNSINNQQIYHGEARVINLENSKLEIIDSQHIGIYLRKGIFENYGIVVHVGNQFTLAMDSLSTLYDPYNSFSFVKEANNTKFYNSIEKEGEESSQETVEVASFLELQDALNNDNVIEISMIADIELPENSQITTSGPVKIIRGNNYSLINHHHQYINFDIPISLIDMNIQSPPQSRMYINFYKGGLVSNVKGDFTFIRSEGIISVQDSIMGGIILHTADASEINNTEIGSDGIYIYETNNFTVQNSKINAAQERNAVHMTYSDGKLKNINVYSGDIGILFEGHSSELYIENTTIENTTREGLTNQPVNSPSIVRLNGLTIKNTGKSNINNSQHLAGPAFIVVEENSTLDLESDDNIAIFQKKGQFENKGTIIHRGNHYTIGNDYISTFIDHSDSFVKVAENQLFTYYNSISREGSEFIQNSVSVDTVEQFIEALENPLVSDIELNDDLVFEDYIKVQVDGIDKLIDGGNYSLSFANHAHFIFPYSASIKNLSIVNSPDSITNLNFEHGAIIENLTSETTVLYGIGKVLISNSLFSQISLSFADGSLLENSEVVNKGFYVDESANVRILNSTVNSTEWNSGVHYSHTSGEIINTTITGGESGFRAYGHNVPVLLKNVNIIDSFNYGIWNTSQSNSSTLYLKDVYIKNAGKYAIYNNKSSRDATITVVEDATLVIEDTNEAAIYQENAFFYNYGTIKADGNRYTILQDYYSVTEDFNNQLYLLNPNSNSYKNYVVRYNYQDTTPPVANLVGSENITLTLGEAYHEPGIEAFDQFDGEISDFTSIGQVNADEVGEYTLSYEVRDLAGNLTRLKRNVIVQPKDVSQVVLGGLADQYIFVGKPINPEISLKDDGKLLVSGKDYELTISNNNQIGEGTILVKGKGNYTGEVSYTFTIIPKVLERIEIQNTPSKTEYIVGQTIELEGLKVIGTYNDGSKETLKIELADIKGFDSSKVMQGLVVSVDIEGHLAEFTLNILPREIEILEVIKMPQKLEYVAGQNIDLSGLIVQATYNDGTTVEADHSQVTVQGFDSSTAVQEQEVIVTFEGKVTSFNVKILPLELQSLKIVDKPSKITYIAGQSLDLTGLRIEGTYNDDSTAILDNSSFSITGFDSRVATQNQKVTLTYKGKVVSYTIDVLPLELTSIKIVKAPDKLDYIEGQPLDLSGLKVEGLYNDESTVILDNSILHLTGFDSSKAIENQEVTLSFEGKSTTFTVNILSLELVRLSVTSEPKKTAYIEGQSLDLSGLRIHGLYNDGSSSIMEHSLLQFSDFDSSTAVESQEVIVKYGNISTGFMVKILPRQIDSLEVVQLPNKLTYIEGQPLDLVGLKVKGTYNDGTNETLDHSVLTVSGFDSSKATGNQTITLSYEGKETSFDVSILPLKVEQINLLQAPDKREYIVGQKLDLTGLVVEGIYNDGSTAILDSSKLVINGFDSSKPIQNQNVTLDLNGKTINFTVNVIPLKLVSLEVVNYPEKIVYTINQSLDLNGLHVQGTYNDGSKTIFDNSELLVRGFDSKKAKASQLVTILKDNIAAEFSVSIQENMSILYQTHIQNYGWQELKRDGKVSGTEGEAKRLEGIKIDLEHLPVEGNIEYQTYVESYGWMDWKQNGEMSGTENEGKRLEAIRIRLTDELAEEYDVYYRVHAESYGWLGWAKNSEEAGTTRLHKRLEAIEIQLVEKNAPAPGKTQTPYIMSNPVISYSTHVQTEGWHKPVENGGMSGTEGKGLRLESIKLDASDPAFIGGIEYRTHIQNIGWQDWKTNNQLSGTEGQALRLEAIQIQLNGQLADVYDVYYRVHAESYGWLDWAKNGEEAGTAGLGKRLEAIEVQLVPKGAPAPGATNTPYIESNPVVSYTTHVQNVGWQDYVEDGAMSGTEEQGLRLEALKMTVSDLAYAGGIEYRTHIQNVGWQDWKTNDQLSGTEGQGLRLEALDIRLSGQLAEHYDVYYRVHAESFGWLGWAKNGESAGTENLAKRLEGMEVRLVPKGHSGPDNTSQAFIRN